MSLLARRNPTVKLAVVAAVSLMLILVIDPVTPVLVGAIALAAGLLLGGLRSGALLRALWPLALIGSSFVWTNALFARTIEGAAVIATLGPFRVSDAGFAFGLGIGLRGIAIGIVSVVFILTTDPSDLVVSLIRHARVPFRIGYPMLAAYRFLPLFADEYAQIALAQRVRGALPGGSPLARARRGIALLVPLLANAVRRSTRIAIAMDARGFAAARERTYLRLVPLTAADAAFALAALGLTAAVLALSAFAGWLRLWDGRFAA